MSSAPAERADEQEQAGFGEMEVRQHRAHVTKAIARVNEQIGGAGARAGFDGSNTGSADRNNALGAFNLAPGIVGD